MYQKLAARIEGKPEERIMSYLMLRSLRQARYSEVNEGHFALAAPSYTHFTSPIRRYPDLIVHRIAKALLKAGIRAEGAIAEGRHNSPWTHPNEALPAEMRLPPTEKRVPHLSRHPDPERSERGVEGPAVRAFAPRVGENFSERVPQVSPLRPGNVIEPPIPEAELAQIAEETSQTERRAAEAERELVEWKKVKFMEDRVGEEFAALVLNPAKFGLFVELTDLFVEGLVPIDSLRDDRYSWRENTHEIVGDRTGRRFRAGDRVQVVLDRILAQERKLQFSIVEEGLPLTAKRPPKSGSKAKKARRKDSAPKLAKVFKPAKKKHTARKGKRR
jgi:ribonuclease R